MLLLSVPSSINAYAHINESRRTREGVASHIWISYVTHAKEPCRKYESPIHFAAVYNIFDNAYARMNEGRRTHDWLMSLMWKSNTTSMKKKKWHGSIRCVTSLIHLRDTALSYIWHDSFGIHESWQWRGRIDDFKCDKHTHIPTSRGPDHDTIFSPNEGSFLACACPTFVRTSVCVNVCVSLCVCVYTRARVRVRVRVRVCKCGCIHMCICVRVCVRLICVRVTAQDGEDA